MKNKSVFFIIGTIILITSIWINLPEVKTQKEYNSAVVEKVENYEFNGVIVEKNITEDNARRIIKIKSLDKENTQSIDLFFEKMKFFNFLKKSDTLIKLKNSLKLQLKRNCLDTVIYFQMSNLKDYSDKKLIGDF